MKKILSLVLAMLMIFSVVPAVFAADAKAEDAHQEALDFLSLIGLYKGGVDASEKLTRWQMALFVSRFITGKLDDAYWATTENDSGFTDVAEFLDKDMKYVVGAVSFAAQQGIINGYGDGKFGPNDGITYRDALVMVVRALGTTYGAVGYPWSYVKTAGDWGLTAGLDNVSHMDQLTRAQVAQILYNALFVEIEGETVAEEIFGVAEDVVIITASNDVQLNEENALVASTGFVQFAVADAEGAPSGTKYHVDAKALGIADANAAVGDAIKVTHMNNFATILSAEDLKVEYKNYAGENEIAIGSGQITLDGVKTYMVSKWTTLNNQQGTNHAADLLESKVYASFGAAQELGTMGKKYYMDEKGYIYEINTLTLVAYYSDFFKALYSAKANLHGIVEFGDIEAVVLTNGTKLKDDITADLTLGNGQYTLTTGAYDSAYAKAEAFDVDGNGVYDRVNLRNYQFGTFYLNADKKTFTLTTGYGIPTMNYGASSIPTLTANIDVLKSLTSLDKNGAFWTNEDSTARNNNYDFRFTGKALSEFAAKKTYYVLYYVDPANHEIDILEVIGQKGAANAAEGKDTYVARGYVLGFHQTNNLIYINDGVDKIKTLSIGYKDMLGAPIFEFQSTAYDTYKAYNDALIELMLKARDKQYIEYVVVNNRLVYTDIAQNVNNNDDVVVIDYFTNISEEGVEAYAWSTATNSYEIIKIAEYNGWNVGGFDWRDYYFSSFLGGTTPNMESLLPVKAGEIYRVVYNNENVYNLAPISPVRDQTIVVDNGYIHNTTSGTAKVVAEATANDYWIIREVEQTFDAQGNLEEETVKKVYTRNGKMAAVTLAGVDTYQMAADTHDFVISGTATELDALKNAIFYDGNIKLMYYKELVGFYDQDWMYDNLGNYYYGHYMMDVLTNEPTFVKYDVTSSAAASRVKAAVEANKDGAIYVVIDDILYEKNATDPQTIEEVKDHYVTSKVYKDANAACGATCTHTVPLTMDAFDGATVVAYARDAVEHAMGYQFWDDEDRDGYYTTFRKVTVIGVSAGKYVNLFGGEKNSSGAYVYADAAAFVKALNNSALAQLADVVLYPVYDDAKNIVIFVDGANPETAKAVTADAVADTYATLPVSATAWATAAAATDYTNATYSGMQNAPEVTWFLKGTTLTVNMTLGTNTWSSNIVGYNKAEVKAGTEMPAGLVVTKADGTTVVPYASHNLLNNGANLKPIGKSYVETLTLTFENVTTVEDLIIWLANTGSSTKRCMKVTIDMQ